MALPLLPLVVSALGAVVAKVFDFLFTFLAYKLARNLAVGVAAVIAAAALTLAMAQGIKLLIMAARVSLPPAFAVGLAFIPPNLNQVVATIITIRVSHFIWQWSMKNLSRYTMQVH
ncbi:DUF5455 family protein [Dechloromonas hortensis]|uniref:DUF5455 family protein n=1 Tax=Dechloromonas hortensis TaxID=337779 RepID=UPI0012909715|nr:DUF5455 family protein [Dechloromonas hortensis]